MKLYLDFKSETPVKNEVSVIKVAIVGVDTL